MISARSPTSLSQPLAAACALALCLVPMASAQNGELDPSFAGTGVLEIDGGLNSGMRDDLATASAVQIDDKVVVVVKSEYSGNDTDIVVARVDTSGNLDPTFGGGDGLINFAIDAGGDDQDEPTAVALLDDGRILIGGWANTDSESGYWMRRLNSNGSFDASFLGTSLVTEAGSDLAIVEMWIEPAGTFLVLVESFAAGAYEPRLYRYQANGTGRTLLQTFSTDYRFFDMVRAADGTIWLAGWFEHPAGDDDVALARISATNVLTYFPYSIDLGGSKDDAAFAIALQNDKPVLAVTADHSTGQAALVMRLNTNGTRDSTFGTNGLVNVLAAPSVVLWADDVLVVDDRILLSGDGSDSGLDSFAFVGSLHADDGALDLSFGLSGIFFSEFSPGPGLDDQNERVHVDSLGRIVLVGTSDVSASNSDATVARVQQAFFADGFESGDATGWSSTSP